MFNANSAPDPNVFPDEGGSLRPAFFNANGRVPVNPATLNAAVPVIVYLGQSLYIGSVDGTFTPTQPAKIWQFNPFDGGLYPLVAPMLGSNWELSLSAAGNNIPQQVTDALVNNGDFTNGIIAANIAIGGTSAADWAPGGKLNNKIPSLMRLLKIKLGKVPKYISWHQGQGDAGLGTAAAAYAASIQAIKGTFDANTDTNLGPTAPMFVGLDTVLANVSNATIRSGQTLAVSGASPALKMVQGGDFDAYVGTPANRQDGTHPSAAGAINMAAAEVAAIHAYFLTH